MKLLLDENLPVKLKYRLLERGLEVFTIADKKWNSKQNGELLKLIWRMGLLISSLLIVILAFSKIY